MEQRSNYGGHTAVYSAVVLALFPLAASAQTLVTAADLLALPTQFTFSTVANLADQMPKGDGTYHLKTFNSFNQPSVNRSGLVVLRGRSKGGHGEAGDDHTESLAAAEAGGDSRPLHGIYARQMGRDPGPITKVLDNRTQVPEPNNLGTALTEFPAFPRIGLDSDTILTRGQSQPVWAYADTREGTSGIYAQRSGSHVSAMTQLAKAPGLSYYSVPGASPGTRFDQFPGAPAVAGWNTVVFKGNYTDGGGKTGVFFRSFSAVIPNASTQLIASSDTPIPSGKGARFGSTAPPSAGDVDMVFLGLDDEANPTLGAIYQAALAPNPPLKTLVKIGGAVPGERGARFTRLGEALSYDGTFVAFWGAWSESTEYEIVTLQCPEHGQAAVIEFCKQQHPNGYPVQIPKQQGFFVHNAQTGQTYAVAKTGNVYSDFLYWTFSGRPPGVGESEAEDFEEPRWRSAAFAAVSGSTPRAQVAFKGRKVGSPAIDGIYITMVGPAVTPVIRTVAETGPSSDGGMIDPSAAAMPITTLGIERDGLRNGWLAFSASMANSLNSWAGVYVTRTVK
jgi:hypothetical protein